MAFSISWMSDPSSLIMLLRSPSDWKIRSRYSWNPTASSTIVRRCWVEMAPSSSIIPWCMMIRRLSGLIPNSLRSLTTSLLSISL